jgi:hypothetical protein
MPRSAEMSDAVHACGACHGWYCMIMCSVFMELNRFRSSWTLSIIMYMHHSPRVQYLIRRCGTAEGTDQHRTTRTFSAFDQYIRYSPISFLSLNLMRRFTALITEAPGIRASYARHGLGGDVRGKHRYCPDHTIFVVYSPWL